MPLTELRYRHGGTRAMILAGGRLAVAEGTVRVHRPRTFTESETRSRGYGF
ncbi:hypothetical protein ACIQWN_33030 [Streptomyces vinaceus]|uniref:hypothetical protein n=1 Tax=Streptomyces vinaceus TaxID=1960 RepID=UPI00381F7EDC